MNLSHVTLLLLTILMPGCDHDCIDNLQDPPQVFEIYQSDSKIVFRGFGNLDLTNKKIPEAHGDAIKKLSSIIANASSETLVDSLRASDIKEELDYRFAVTGNWMIIEELADRRPLPSGLKSRFRERNIEIFVGSSSVGTGSLEELMERTGILLESEDPE